MCKFGGGRNVVPGGGSGILGINHDSAQEFRVITNSFNPEFGRNTGAIIDVVTREGTNNLETTSTGFPLPVTQLPIRRTLRAQRFRLFSRRAYHKKTHLLLYKQ